MRFRPRPGANCHLVCFPPAGGGASFFRKWPALLPPDVELIAVQLPGRENRFSEHPASEIVATANQVARALSTEPLGQVVLFGHSMGAVIAYETAHILASIVPRLPVALVVSGRESPDAPMQNLEFSHMTDEEFFREVGDRYGGVPPAIQASPELRELLAPALRADLAAVGAYREPPFRQLSIDLTVLYGRSDPFTAGERISGWRSRTTGKVAIQGFDGGHFFPVDNLPDVVAAAIATRPLP